MEPVKDNDQIDLNHKETSITMDDMTGMIGDFNEEFASSLERKQIRKQAKKLHKQKKQGLLSTDNQEGFHTIESKLLSKREQVLLIKEYFKIRFWKELMIIMLAALLVTIDFDYFISSTGKTGLFPAGLGAIARFFAILTFQNDVASQGSFYFIYYFMLNLPLFVFGAIKLGKKFTFTTFIFILCQIGFDQVITNIPFINPTEFHVIVDYQLLESIGGSWNSAIWLFIFAIVGGLLMGASYSMVYKIGSSTGGADFLTFFISKKTSKPVGTVNRNVNFIILGIIIILNSIIVKPSDLNPDIILKEVNRLYNEDPSGNNPIWNDLIRFAFDHNNGIAFINGQNLDPTFASHFGITEKWDQNTTMEQMLTWFNKHKNDNIFTEQNFRFLSQICAQKGFGDTLSPSSVFITKVSFIFGPSMFASIILVICNAVAQNAFYPKYKVRTYMIITNNPKEVNGILLQSGFQNDIMTWDATNRINGNYLHRSVVSVSMSVMDWDFIEKQIFLVDPEVKITILKTKAVKGMFNYEVSKNDDRDLIKEKVSSNEIELEKIRQVAIVKYNKELKRKLKVSSRKNKKDKIKK